MMAWTTLRTPVAAFALLAAVGTTNGLAQQPPAATTGTKAGAKAGAKVGAKVPGAAGRSSAVRDSIVVDSLERFRLAADERFFERRLLAQRALYLKRGSWAQLGDRCNPGALRVFPKDTSSEQRQALQQMVEGMEQTIVARGVGARLDTPEAQVLLRTIVGWEAGIDRPLWDADGPVQRMAVATGLTGEVPDPRGPGCLASPVAADTVTFVLPGFATMEFPSAAKPRVKAYFGPAAQGRARDEFFAIRGSREPEAELSYILVAPVVIWRGWALVGVDRPREKGGVEIRSGSNGGAVYLMRRVGPQWRLVTVVRSWGS